MDPFVSYVLNVMHEIDVAAAMNKLPPGYTLVTSGHGYYAKPIEPFFVAPWPETLQ